MATRNGRRGLWQPPAETLEALAAVLKKHWRAAAGSHPTRLFWPAPPRWLEGRTRLITPAPVSTGPVSTWPVTTSLPAAD